MPSAQIYEYPSVPLNILGWQVSQFTEHVNTWVGTVNTASLNFDNRPGRIQSVDICIFFDFLFNPTWEITSAYIKVRIYIYLLCRGISVVF